ncbi:MAG: aminotransferase class V-fold PLP-dependent enzyme [Desulfobacterales bacterium]|nr:MAG: aminotransferase class V-fold PLP-dependent enzyme [Desulfobacterales bacterium]
MANKRIFLSPPHMGGEELRYVKKAFESNYVAPAGPHLESLERAFSETVEIPYAVALSSGTAAMHIALRSLGVGPGDEVIASTMTFIGSVSPVTFFGGVPVFIDSDLTSWNMDPDLLANELEACKKRGKLPRAVIPTDLYGQCCDLDRIIDICEPYNIPVVVDAAEALGATYNDRSAGAGAKAAIFSFNGNKIITTSGGGILASEDKELIEYARKLSQQAREPFPHYEHKEIGYNYRMSNILAAIGLGQLKVLNDRVTKKRKIFDFYYNALKNVPGVEFMPEARYGRSNRWLTVILITPEEFGADRETVRLALESENIESRPVWKPMHMQPVFRAEIQGQKLLAKNGSINPYPARVVGGSVAEDLFFRGLCLPSGTAMTKGDLNRIVSVIIKCRKNKYARM